MKKKGRLYIIISAIIVFVIFLVAVITIMLSGKKGDTTATTEESVRYVYEETEAVGDEPTETDIKETPNIEPAESYLKSGLDSETDGSHVIRETNYDSKWYFNRVAEVMYPVIGDSYEETDGVIVSSIGDFMIDVIVDEDGLSDEACEELFIPGYLGMNYSNVTYNMSTLETGYINGFEAQYTVGIYQAANEDGTSDERHALTYRVTTQTGSRVYFSIAAKDESLLSLGKEYLEDMAFSVTVLDELNMPKGEEGKDYYIDSSGDIFYMTVDEFGQTHYTNQHEFEITNPEKDTVYVMFMWGDITTVPIRANVCKVGGAHFNHDTEYSMPGSYVYVLERAEEGAYYLDLETTDNDLGTMSLVCYDEATFKAIYLNQGADGEPVYGFFD